MPEWFEVVRDVFAVIGATAAVGGLGWRVYTWRHGRRSHLRVTVENAFPVYGSEVGEWCFSVTAVSRSEHPVKVTSAGFVAPDGRDLVIVKPPFPGALPTEIQPHDSAQTWIEVAALEREGFDVYGPIKGWVRTSTGERFASKPKVLKSREESASD